MNVRRFLFAFPFLLAVGCNDLLTDEPDTRNPEWLDALIAQIQVEEVTAPPTEIFRYRYHGETVYYRTARCCDIRSVVYDAEGNVLCEPDGGVDSGGDDRCPDFLATRTDEVLIFRDSR